MVRKAKKKLLLLLAAILTVVLAACSSGASSEVASESTGEESSGMDKVVVNEAIHTLLYLPFYVAYHEGIFEENGIEISSILSAGTGPAALSSVISGEAQFSIHGPEHVAFAKENGGEARAISAMANSAPTWILANKDVKFTGPEDLAGKRIVVGQAPGTSHTLLTKLLQDTGLDIQKDVTVTEVQIGSELGPVLAGQADIAVVLQPQADQGIAQGLKIIHDFTKDYPEFAYSTVNTSVRTMESNPDLVKRFAQSIQTAHDLVHSKPEIAIEIAKKEFPEIKENIIETAVQRMIDSNVYPESAKVSEEAFETAVDIQQFVGNIEGDLNYEDVVNSSFTE